MGKKHRAKKNNAGRRRADRFGGGVPPRVPAGGGRAPNKPAPRKPERSLIAAHEAGHGVAYMVLFGGVKRLVIDPDNSGGRTVGTGPLVCANATRADLDAAMLVAFAGFAAECLLVPNRRGFGQGSAVDFAYVRRFAKMGTYTEPDVFYVFLATLAFVAAYRAEIEAVADSLKRCGSLRGAKVVEITAASRACEQAA